MSVGNPLFPDAFLGISRRRATASRNLLYNCFSSVKYRTETERGKERRSKPRGKKRGDRSPSVDAVSPLSTTLGCVGYPAVMMDDMFLEFEDDLDNIAGGSSSVGDNAESSSQQHATSTPRRRVQSQLLKLERHVAINGRIR
ncbi:CACTA en-spm transposon protein [Cucumis melo var. makuwa]|uniref:CACTA en-spm transposon protein n=1 Tax=Cucumis melo var. makuwa TaxID=1194695 RepID=A0A5D3DD74_CUCMM|nr:CACTA en-spm transposon protein [Cucumis melo var. makuwa]TYK21468.1 CACTA en-spm transposon protein [Cucumis melo var. makuwa]